MHFGDKKGTPRYSRASTMSPTMENSQRDFVNGKSVGGGSVPGGTKLSNGISTLERQVAKKKELNSILRNKSVERSLDTVDGPDAGTVNGEVGKKDPANYVPKLSKENLSKHVRIFAVDNNSDSDHHESELGYTSDRRPSFGSLRGYNLHSRRISIDSLDTRRGDSRRGSIASTVQGEEVFSNKDGKEILTNCAGGKFNVTQ